jgi:hypothetical protein
VVDGRLTETEGAARRTYLSVKVVPIALLAFCGTIVGALAGGTTPKLGPFIDAAALSVQCENDDHLR